MLNIYVKSGKKNLGAMVHLDISHHPVGYPLIRNQVESQEEKVNANRKFPPHDVPESFVNKGMSVANIGAEPLPVLIGTSINSLL